MTSGKHKALTTEPTIAPAVKNAFWHMWLGVTAAAWIPLIIVGLIRKEPWHITLAVLAILWLISTSKNLSKSPAWRYYLPPLILGGTGIAVLGFLNTSSLFSTILIFAIVIVFISSPSYAFNARHEEIKKK